MIRMIRQYRGVSFNILIIISVAVGLSYGTYSPP